MATLPVINGAGLNPVTEVKYPFLGNKTLLEWLDEQPKVLFGTEAAPPDGNYPDGSTYDQYEE